MMQDMTKVFDTLRKKAESQANPSGGQGYFSNPNLLKLKQGCSYKLRLLWIAPPEGMNREYPMINQYIHHFWDNNAVGSKNIEVYCKTSQYDKGETRAGWECPICKEMSKCYKEYSSTGSQSAKEIYDTFRRTFRGYVPVYVIAGPEEDLHKVKILQYTKTFKDFFDLNIFGIAKNQKNEDGSTAQIAIDEDDVLGIQAFTYYEPKTDEVQIEAYDLSIIVNSKSIPIKGKMTKVPDYTIKFSKNMSEIDFDGEAITPERYLGLSEELNFDKDFLKKSTTEELENFLTKYVMNDTAVEEAIDEEVEEVQVVKSEKIDKIKEISKASKPVKKVVETKPVKEEVDLDDLEIEDEGEGDNLSESESEESSASFDEEDVDIDELLKDI